MIAFNNFKHNLFQNKKKTELFIYILFYLTNKFILLVNNM